MRLLSKLRRPALFSSLRRYSDVLDVAALLTEPQTYFQEKLYGDKDAFRFTWLLFRLPFYYVP